MADFAFNRMKGREVEAAERVNANDPTNAVFVWAAVLAAGVESDAVLIDKDDFAAVFSGTTDEATNAGYARVTWDQASGLTVTYNDTSDRVELDGPDVVFGAPAASPGAWSDILSGYDSDSTGGTDSAILPLTWHDFPVTPDSSTITAVLPSGGFLWAT